MKKFFCLVLTLFALTFSFKTHAVSAKSAVVINGDTGEIIYSKDADIRLPMASTTKIMTALLLCEYGNLEKEITVTEEMVKVEGTSMGLLAGDRVTLHDLLYGMLLCSGNDSANAIAITLGGTIENFAKMMNNKAKELNLANTSFVTPSGLDAENHYTTAYELALITKKAFEYTEFQKAVSSKTAVLSYGNPPYKRTLSNHNKLLKMYDDVVGVKTGFTKKSGRCLVSASRKDGKFIIAVTLNDKNDWADHRELLDIGLSSVSVRDVKSYSNSINILNGEKQRIDVLSDNMSISANGDAEIVTETYLPMFVYAPVKNNDIIGYNVFYCNGSEIGRQKIKSSEDIEIKKQKKTEKIMQIFICIFRSINERQ